MEAITPIKVNRNRNYLVVDCWLSWSRLDYRHHYDRRRQFPGQGGYAVAVNRKGRYSMLDEKDLQAIAQLMEKQKQDIMSETKGLLEQQKQDIMHDVKVLLDTEVTTRFNLLAEGQQVIMDAITPKSEIEELRNEVSVLKLAIRTMNQEIAELKKAQ